jgi:hypothetical protein
MSNTNITTTTETTTVTVTENVVEIELNNAGVQGIPGVKGDTGNTGPTGPKGDKGDTGDTGAGVASGGTAGQILAKVDGTNFNTTWIDNAAEQTLYLVRNNTGTTILKGTLLAASGAEPSGRIDVEPFVVTGLQDSELRVMGVATANISNGVNGTVMSFGTLVGVDTRGNFASALAVGDETWAVGDILFAHPTVAGKLTKVRPQHDLAVAFITVRNATAGQIAIRIVPGNFHLEWLHDVSITSPTNNQVLTYDSASSLWVNANNPADGVTSITATAPLTGGTITSTGSIGLDQTALSITKSQVSDFTSGTVTSASTAQQAGTAVFANTSGTATYSTTSGTALTISGDITRSQVSDFASGTVAQADNATTSGTAVFATNASTAVFSSTSGTATFATNASTAVNVSGSAITQSQIVNLVSDLAGKANLAGGNALTGVQTIGGAASSATPLMITGANPQNEDYLRIRRLSDSLDLVRVTNTGVINTRVSVWTPAVQGNNGVGGTLAFPNAAPILATPQSATTVVMAVRGAASQSADLLQLQNSAGTNLVRVDSGGGLFAAQGAKLGLDTFAGVAFNGISNPSGITSIPSLVVKANPSQTSNVQEWHNSAGVVRGYIDRFGDVSIGSLGLGFVTPYSSYGGSLLSINTVGAGNIGAVIRGFASQTADLLQIQTSAGTNIYRFDPFGYSTVTGGYVLSNSGGSLERAFGGAFLGLARATSAATNPGANIGRLYFRDGTNPGTLRLCVRAGAAGAETTIFDNIPQ